MPKPLDKLIQTLRACTAWLYGVRVDAPPSPFDSIDRAGAPAHMDETVPGTGGAERARDEGTADSGQTETQGQ